jgi:hypothetical protein
MFAEILGYTASVLVAVSLTMRSVLKLRLVNLAGALFFTIYGWLIGAYPIMAVNALIVAINLYYLREIFGRKEYFSPLEISPHSDYLRRFVQFYQAEIAQFNPAFVFTPRPDDLIFFVLRDMVPAGLFMASPREDGVLHVQLDFVTPSYRDYRVGQFVYRQMADIWRSRGYRLIVSPPGNAPHADYLRRMGFSADSRHDGLVLPLRPQ